MVLGKKGLRVEAWKFGIYLMIPIGASLAFNEPKVQRFCADYFQFLRYPANPNTDLKKEFDELRKKRELEREQRLAYKEQMKKLQSSVQTTTGSDEQPKQGWWGKLKRSLAWKSQ